MVQGHYLETVIHHRRTAGARCGVALVPQHIGQAIICALVFTNSPLPRLTTGVLNDSQPFAFHSFPTGRQQPVVTETRQGRQTID
ncbi:hypothetical protein D3C73_833490 [compost metagenome]